MRNSGGWTCYMSGVVLNNPMDVYRVHSGRIPEGIQNAEKLAGKFVCEEQARLLRQAGFVVFNWGKHLERKQETAKTTIGEMLAAKVGGNPLQDLVEAKA